MRVPPYNLTADTSRLVDFVTRDMAYLLQSVKQTQAPSFKSFIRFVESFATWRTFHVHYISTRCELASFIIEHPVTVTLVVNPIDPIERYFVEIPPPGLVSHEINANNCQTHWLILLMRHSLPNKSFRTCFVSSSCWGKISIECQKKLGIVLFWRSFARPRKIALLSQPIKCKTYSQMNLGHSRFPALFAYICIEFWLAPCGIHLSVDWLLWLRILLFRFTTHTQSKCHLRNFFLKQKKNQLLKLAFSTKLSI